MCIYIYIYTHVHTYIYIYSLITCVLSINEAYNMKICQDVCSGLDGHRRAAWHEWHGMTDMA